MLDAPLIEPPSDEMKPARTYIAEAVPTNRPNLFYARFAWPGTTPLFVSEDGVPVVFNDADSAEAEAAIAVIDALNNRPGMPGATARHTLAAGTVVRGNVKAATGAVIQDGTTLEHDVTILRPIKPREKHERYEKLFGNEFALALADAGITPTFFAYLYGTNMERVVGWMDGVDEKDLAPHPARVLLAIFKAHPETIDTAEAVTEQVTTQRNPSRKAR